jgi:hypothetical protein
LCTCILTGAVGWLFLTQQRGTKPSVSSYARNLSTGGGSEWPSAMQFDVILTMKRSAVIIVRTASK